MQLKKFRDTEMSKNHSLRKVGKATVSFPARVSEEPGALLRNGAHAVARLLCEFKQLLHERCLWDDVVGSAQASNTRYATILWCWWRRKGAQCQMHYVCTKLVSGLYKKEVIENHNHYVIIIVWQVPITTPLSLLLLLGSVPVPPHL